MYHTCIFYYLFLLRMKPIYIFSFNKTQDKMPVNVKNKAMLVLIQKQTLHYITLSLT